MSITNAASSSSSAPPAVKATEHNFISTLPSNYVFSNSGKPANYDTIKQMCINTRKHNSANFIINCVTVLFIQHNISIYLSLSLQGKFAELKLKADGPLPEFLIFIEYPLSEKQYRKYVKDLCGFLDQCNRRNVQVPHPADSAEMTKFLTANNIISWESLGHAALSVEAIEAIDAKAIAAASLNKTAKFQLGQLQIGMPGKKKRAAEEAEASANTATSASASAKAKAKAPAKARAKAGASSDAGDESECDSGDESDVTVESALPGAMQDDQPVLAVKAIKGPGLLLCEQVVCDSILTVLKDRYANRDTVFWDPCAGSGLIANTLIGRGYHKTIKSDLIEWDRTDINQPCSIKGVRPFQSYVACELNYFSAEFSDSNRSYVECPLPNGVGAIVTSFPLQQRELFFDRAIKDRIPFYCLLPATLLSAGPTYDILKAAKAEVFFVKGKHSMEKAWPVVQTVNFPSGFVWVGLNTGNSTQFFT